MQLIKKKSVPSDYDIPNDLILPLFMKRYGYVIMPSCMTGVIWSQPKEVNQALMVSSWLVLFEVTVATQTFTDTSPGYLINMPIVV